MTEILNIDCGELAFYQDADGVWRVRKKAVEVWVVYAGKEIVELIFETFKDAVDYAETKEGATKVETTNFHPSFREFGNNKYTIRSKMLYKNLSEAVDARNRKTRDYALSKLSKEERKLLGINS